MPQKAVTVILLNSLIIPIILASGNLPRAQTEQGVYIGSRSTINDITVACWYGIPYAEQPVDNLRWLPPLPLPTSNEINIADAATLCPQLSSFEPPYTEACLTLNVHAPENATNLPVYVWIHGGSFTTGAGGSYNATPFVITSINYSVPIVVVTINYRIGLLGFLADEALYNGKSGVEGTRTTGNYGILDQMMALDWIKKNIRGFGGNPEEITIGGESAGGISVSVLLTSPLVKTGTFQRAIVQSGGIWPNATKDLQTAFDDSGNILRPLVNCSTVECLRNLTVKQILRAQKTIASKNIFGTAATPVVDGYVLNDTIENSYARGNFQKVPVLVGSTTNETSLYTCQVFQGSATEAQVQEFFRSIYNSNMSSGFPDIYGPMSVYNESLTYLNIIYSDSWLHCGSRRIAAQFSNSKLPSYLFTYNHLIPVTPRCFGVTHSTELPMFFPSLVQRYFPKYNLTEEEKQLSINMMRYWANFIRTSNPNFEGSAINWNTYSINSDNDLVLDTALRMRNYHYKVACSSLWDLYATTNDTPTSSAISSTKSRQRFQSFFCTVLFQIILCTFTRF
ncbi:unnamed protein product [Adineta ricciae]|uniref:Carboxylic ester hydrolase n=2 Tax=Adineta ricciae TaxID=249248 RepID=A0A815SGC6_ADIRI|nr:unnamed protein product [Adineta ricciae]